MPETGISERSERVKSSMMVFGGNISFDHRSQEWSIFKSRFVQYCTANDIQDDTDKSGIKRRALLLTAFGEETYRVARDLVFPDSLDTVEYSSLLEKLNIHFQSKKSTFAERYKFYKAEQRTGEDLTEWAARVRNLAQFCGFKSELETALRDRFVLGLDNTKEKEKLFAESIETLTFSKALEMAQSVRCARAALQMARPATSGAEALADASAQPVFALQRRAAQGGAGASGSGSAPGSHGDNSRVLKCCEVCGYKNHTKDQCRFANYQCQKCKKRGHLKRMCKAKISNNNFLETDDDGANEVCSTIGLTSEQAADYDSRPNSKMSLMHHDLNMDSHWTSKMNKKYINYNENVDEVKSRNNVIENDIQARNLDYHISTVLSRNNKMRNFDPNSMDVKNRVKRDDKNAKCESFKFEPNDKFITHPHPKNTGSTYYYNNTDCVTKINATSTDQVIQLTFVDVFRIEYHPECVYDYLEIRDGYYGYADLLGRFCGQTFPRTLKTKGPNVWLKFHSDETIEYEGFKINVEFKNGPSHHIPEACYKTFEGNKWGFIDTKEIDPLCKDYSTQALDVLWTIIVPVDMKIYLNFTNYGLAKPNECNENIIQVFETKDQELDTKLAEYCGSVANSVTTKERNGHIMYVRMYVTKDARKDTAFRATFNAYRTLEGDEKCGDDEFDCEDNTCIDINLQCDNDAHCRLKADEDKSCNKKVESTINQPHILVILIIFSLILSGMSFVFIFKCIRKLYQDHKIIKEHIRQSCEDRLDRLDSLVGSRLTLDPKRLQRDSEPRASLERDNHNNEMVKKQRSFSKHKQSSIDSDYQETHLDLDEEIWRREVESIPIEENVHIERNGRTRKSDMSRKEESMKRRKEIEEREKMEHKREIRDVSVGAPDTKESGCQTRESLFQTDPPPSSDGSGSNSRGFSTFGYSGATIVRPSPPATTNTSEITIELLKQIPPHQETKPQKKLPDRRPISTETTRSAPDVIIVSKPIR